MKQTLIAVGLCLFFAGCNQKEKEKNYMKWKLGEVSKSYNEELNKIDIPAKLLSHFPAGITKLPIKLMIPDIKISNESIQTILYEFDVERSKIDSMVAILDSNKVQNYLPSDSNLIVLKQQVLRKEDYKKVEVMLPIPFFEIDSFSHPEDVVRTEDIYSETSKSGLSKDFRIFVLESEKGKYWKELEPDNYMLKEWENGYSKGIAINQKNNTIIYWVVIW